MKKCNIFWLNNYIFVRHLLTHFPQIDFQFNNFRVIDGSMKDMLKKFNTKETWIDVETLANLKGVSKRAIRLSFNSKNSNYETKIENGKGRNINILDVKL